MGTHRTVGPKSPSSAPFGMGNPSLDAFYGRVGTRFSGCTITNVGDRKESPAGAPLRVPSLDLSREYRAIGPMLLKAVEGVFSSQSFIMGPQVAEFERAAAKKCE